MGGNWLRLLAVGLGCTSFFLFVNLFLCFFEAMMTSLGAATIRGTTTRGSDDEVSLPKREEEYLVEEPSPIGVIVRPDNFVGVQIIISCN